MPYFSVSVQASASQNRRPSPAWLMRPKAGRLARYATGELLRQITLDPSRDYQPTGRPPGPPPRTPANGKPRTLMWVQGHSDALRDHKAVSSRIRTCAHGSGGRRSYLRR
jgi:hypothetical protein